MEHTKERITGDTGIYRFLSPEYGELGAFEYSLQDIIGSRKIDGLLIRNVLNPGEVAGVLDTFRNHPRPERVHRDEVTISPKGFAAFLDEEGVTLEDYYASGKEYNATFIDIYGIDLFGRLKDVLGTLSGLDIRVVRSEYGETPFGQIRDLYAGKSGMPLHCGRVFQDFYRGFYEFMTASVDYRLQLSYFIMLQETEAGGELILIDREYEDGQQMKPFDEMVEADGSIVNIHDENVRRMVIKPGAGDMILFNGSTIWHKVGDIRGASDRITFGGFMGFKEAEGEIVLWA